jgi:hypothetical protein
MSTVLLYDITIKYIRNGIDLIRRNRFCHGNRHNGTRDITSKPTPVVRGMFSLNEAGYLEDN